MITWSLRVELSCSSPKYSSISSEISSRQVFTKLAPIEFTISTVNYSRVRTKYIAEAERVGKYRIRPVLSLERLSLDGKQGQVCYRYGKEAKELEAMDYLELIARVTSHIPDKSQVMVRYYGLYANAHRGKSGRRAVFPSPGG